VSVKRNTTILPVLRVTGWKGPGCLQDFATFVIADSVLGDYRFSGTVYVRFAEGDSTISVPVDAAAKFKRGWELINK
jgi:hypothetical protein